MAARVSSGHPLPALVSGRPTFEEIYAHGFEFVWRSLRRLGVSAADIEDATQEVFLVVHRRLPDFEERAKWTTWLFKICWRMANTRRRRAHVRREVLDSDGLCQIPGGEPDAADELQRRSDLLLFDRAAERLPLEQRAVFVSFELEGMSGQDIAEALEIPLGTVYSRLRLARASFRRSVELLAARREALPRAEGSR